VFLWVTERTSVTVRCARKVSMMEFGVISEQEFVFMYQYGITESLFGGKVNTYRASRIGLFGGKSPIDGFG